MTVPLDIPEAIWPCCGGPDRHPAGVECFCPSMVHVGDQGHPRAVRRADPDRACPHENYACVVTVGRLSEVDGGPITNYSAEVKVTCAECGEPFRFIGTPAGISSDFPTVDVAETTLFAPIAPRSADPDFGLGLPGFSVRRVDPPGEVTNLVEAVRAALAISDPGAELHRMLGEYLAAADRALHR